MRQSQPTQLIKLEGNKNKKTKSEIEHREKMEQAVYTGINFRESPSVKSDPVAHKEFLRLRKLYKHIQFVDGLDQEAINRYCLMVSQEKQLQNQFDTIIKEIEKTDGLMRKLELYEFMNKATTKLNQTRDAILKLEDRLFLNPAGRLRAIPKKPQEKPKKSQMAQFIKKRAGGSHAT